MKKKENIFPWIILLTLAAVIWILINIHIIFLSSGRTIVSVKPGGKQASSISSAGGLVTPGGTLQIPEGKVLFGRTAYLPNSLKIFIFNSSNWIKLEPGQPVFEKDQIKTSPSSQVDIKMNDLNKIRILENTEIELISSSSNKEKNSGPQIKIISGKVKAASSLEVTVDNGLHVYGNSVFTVEKKDKITRITVYRGSAEVSSGGKSVLVKRNQGTLAESGKAPEEPFNLPSAPRQIKLSTH